MEQITINVDDELSKSSWTWCECLPCQRGAYGHGKYRGQITDCRDIYEVRWQARCDGRLYIQYRYLNFDELPNYVETSDKIEISAEMKEAAKKLCLL